MTAEPREQQHASLPQSPATAAAVNASTAAPSAPSAPSVHAPTTASATATPTRARRQAAAAGLARTAKYLFYPATRRTRTSPPSTAPLAAAPSPIAPTSLAIDTSGDGRTLGTTSEMGTMHTSTSPSSPSHPLRCPSLQRAMTSPSLAVHPPSSPTEPQLDGSGHDETDHQSPTALQPQPPIHARTVPASSSDVDAEDTAWTSEYDMDAD